MSQSSILEKNLTHITLDRTQLAEFCQTHGIRKLSLFGSILREDFNPDRSDVDFLVEFLPNATPGFFGLVGMENELSTMIGRKADLRTPQELSRYFRQEVMDEAMPQYEQLTEKTL
ncbi:MAG: nucleotidyltransferase family protein [Leptolyngbyaceae cyanobacterium SL_5_9]|nr:nucleotidyltransferase family protein [Leptolyngbyaceae cyanobacterium SL_5_9]NJO73786.1 nucleotidyltransferase family protein [Leptolyngbyaceae cyanobacterium RM1_406_9]